MTTPAPGDAVQTLGPADPNAGFRAKLYSVSTLILPLLGMLATFGILSSSQVNDIYAIVTGISGLLGLGVAGLAASKTRQQVNNGTFDQAPPPPPERTAAEAIQAIGQQLNEAITSSVAQVNDGIASVQAAAGAITSIGAQVVAGPVGELLDSVKSETK